MSKKPVHTIRFGNISAAIWENEGQKGTFHSVTLTRSYKDGDQWKDTPSMNRDDLLVAAKCLDQAHSWICDQAQAQRQDVAA